MTTPDPRDRPATAAPAAHARHDTFLVAAHAAGDLDGASRATAESQIASCTACSALYDDLRAIAGATHSLSNVTIPASASGRDFRLTPEQAARLDRGRGWRRLLQPLATGASWTRPLAAALTTLGLAGVLLTTVLPGIGGLASGGASSSATERISVQAGAPTAAAPVIAGPTAAPAPAAGGVPDAGGGVAVTSGPSTAVDELGPAAIASAPNASAEAGTGATSAGRNSTTEAPAPVKGVPSATAPDFAAGGAPAESAGGPTSNAQDGMKYEPLQQSPSQDSLLPIASVVLVVLGLALFGLRAVARRLS